VVSVKNSPFYEDNSTEIHFKLIPTENILTLKPKDANVQLVMKVVDSAHNMPIPNLKIEATVNQQTFSATSNEKGELSIELQQLSLVKGKQITFATSDSRVISKFNPVTVTQAKTPVVQSIEAYFALLAVIMKGIKGLPLAKVDFKLNNEIIHTTLSDYNGKAVCFVKKELLTDY